MNVLQPYLFFNGNCEEAMNFYKSVFGGELTINHFSDYDPSKKPEDGVMHSTLENDALTFMGSDAMEEANSKGKSVSLSVAGDDEALLTKMFNDLAVGGTVTKPLSKEVWGDTFGMLDDKYGFHWMFNITAPKTQEV